MKSNALSVRFWATVIRLIVNEAVTTTADYVDYLADDPNTRVIATFTETVRNPERYVAALDKAITLVASLFAFIHSFDETVIAIFIAGRDAHTLPKKMYESVRLEADPVLAVVSTLLFLLVLIGTVIAAVTRRRPANAT